MIIVIIIEEVTKMENNSLSIFRHNIEKLLNTYSTYEKLALFLDVPVSTLKSWVNGNRNPNLKTLDRISNKIGCYSYELLCNNSDLKNIGMYTNNSHNTFVTNLNILFLKNHCFSVPQKLSLLENEITDFALQSYLRKENYKTPTILKLDIIANALKLETYTLLKENIT